MYAAAGTYTVSLTVTDDDGASSVAFTEEVTIEPPVNLRPDAQLVATTTGLTVAFDGSGSSDTDGTIASWAWTFGDGSSSTPATPTHVYAAAGTYVVSLTVTDDDGATDTVAQSVHRGRADPGGLGRRWCGGQPGCLPDGGRSGQPRRVPGADPGGLGRRWCGGRPGCLPDGGRSGQQWRLRATPLGGGLRQGDERQVQAVRQRQPEQGQRVLEVPGAAQAQGRLVAGAGDLPDEGSKETRTINLKKGVYRVWVNPKYGHLGAFSREVSLRK